MPHIRIISFRPRRTLSIPTALMATWISGLSLTVIAAEPEHRVELGRIEQRNLATVLDGFGSLEPMRKISISAQGQGRLVEMGVREGEWMEAGDLLLQLDPRADQIALRRADAEKQKAELELSKLQAGSRPEEIEEARRRLSAAVAVMKAAEEEWERVDSLAKQGIAAASELSRARSDYDVSIAQHSQAKARLALVEEGARSEEVLIAETEVTIRTAAVEAIRRRLDDLTVKAPFKGVVSRQIMEIGEWASPGDVALEMMVMDPMRLRISVPQKHIAFIRPDQTATITIPGVETPKLQGQVVAVIPQASEGSRNFPVVLRLENPERRLAAGMYAKVSLVLGDGRDALVAPRIALQYRDQRLVLFRFNATEKTDQGTVSAIEVRVGRELEGEVVVEPLTDGQLQPDDRIVILGGSKLKDGDAVKVLPPTKGLTQVDRRRS